MTFVISCHMILTISVSAWAFWTVLKRSPCSTRQGLGLVIYHQQISYCFLNSHRSGVRAQQSVNVWFETSWAQLKGNTHPRPCPDWSSGMKHRWEHRTGSGQHIVCLWKLCCGFFFGGGGFWETSSRVGVDMLGEEEWLTVAAWDKEDKTVYSRC